MIIKRKYVKYRQLLNDPASKDAIYNAIKNCSKPMNTKEIDSIMQADSWVIAQTKHKYWFRHSRRCLSSIYERV